MRAISDEDVELVRMLLDAGADIDGDALSNAEAKGNKEIIQLLRDAGAIRGQFVRRGK